MKLNSQNTFSVIKNIHKIRPTKYIGEIILSIIEEIDYIPVLKVREILFNRD